MGRKTALFISILTHPLLMPSYAFLLLFSLNAHISYRLPLTSKLYLLLLILIPTFFVPVLLFYSMKKSGLIKSFHMETKEERRYPLVATTILFIIPYFLIRNLPLPEIYKIFMLGSFLLLGVTTLITYVWKISAHMIAIGAVTGTFIMVSIIYNLKLIELSAALILLSGLVGYARLQLKAHHPSQIYAGFLFGSLFFCWFINLFY